MKLERGILSAIGCTPVIRLNKLPGLLYAKLEMFNPGGSIKDRPAFRMLYEALKSGKITKDSTIIESSSGNMAIGLAQVCRYFGLKLIVVVDPKINQHTLHILQAYGVHIEQVQQANSDGNYLLARLQRVRDLLDRLPDGYWPNQYANKYNPAAHYRTMEEIVDALPGPPDYLLVATSTCGTIMGCANYVHQHELNTKIVAVDAVGSVIFGSPPADRLVPGYGAGRRSDLLRKGTVDHVIHISDKECITGCRQLLNREAILAGGSSGAVVMAAEKLQPSIPEKSTCALILPDSGERYLDTIFNDEWVKKHFEEKKGIKTFSGEANSGKLNRPSACYGAAIQSENSPTGGAGNMDKLKIAIIGGGPKGMYGFEQLASRFMTKSPEDGVEIHIYNKGTHFGAGEIYQPDQPLYLLTNNPIDEINMWANETPAPISSVPLSLKEWIKKREQDGTGVDYVPRARVGEYLEEGFKQIASNLPTGVSGQYIIGEVIDIYKNGEKYSLKMKTAAGIIEKKRDLYDYILLATGHPRNKAGKQEKTLQKYSEANKRISFTPFIYPVQSTLKDIPSASKVAIKGIGLTFVDAVLALTEGRGGTFECAETRNNLIYKPSGREPKVIYPFSRSGLPMIPREPTPKDATSLKFFTELALKAAGKNGEKLNFKGHILPLLKREMIYAYYEVKMRQSKYNVDLSTCSSFQEVQYHIDMLHHQCPDIQRFDPDLFLEPTKDEQFKNAGDFNTYIQSLLRFFLNEAKKGEHSSPWAAVTAVWRKATAIFGEAYAFGGLTPSSQQYFDERFRRLLNRVSFGPPVESMQKILALMEADILNFEMAQNPFIRMDKKNRTFVLESDRYNVRQPIHHIVDARISKVSLWDDEALLYRNMLRRGLVSMFKNELDQQSYLPGCIAITPKGFAIDEKGNTNFSIAVTGTPTEGITFDNDTLSRNRNNFVSGWAAFIQESHMKSRLKSHA